MHSAILVKNAVYRHRQSDPNVLNGLSMTVQTGSIYGLTGSSGCGKTTLISCILGERKLNSGKIYLNGSCVAEESAHIVRNQMSYMPQETAVFPRFTVLEMLTFFGQLAGFSKDVLEFKLEQQLELMELTHRKNVALNRLSGGECRRLSLAATLISSKKILMLDEPTVGMDPLIQTRIWKQLRCLVSQQQYTVFITTHYFEEMKIADKIGVMSGGRLQIEASPEDILSVTNCSSISDAMSKIQKTPQLRESLQNVSNEDVVANVGTDAYLCQSKHKQQSISYRAKHMLTLTKKCFKQQIRNIPLYFFIILVPPFHLLSMYPMGFEPSRLRLGVVNMELNTSMSDPNCSPNTNSNLNDTCNWGQLSCTFLNLLDLEKVALTYQASEVDALAATHKGLSYGYIYFSEAFSASLVDRTLTAGSNMTAFLKSQIVVRLDQTSRIIRFFVLKELYKTQESFMSVALAACLETKTTVVPLQYAESVYGDVNDYSFFSYCATGYSPLSLFIYSIVSSALHVVQDRTCGMTKRLLVSGISIVDIIIAHYVAEVVLAAIQSSIMLGIMYGLIPMGRHHVSPMIFSFVLINGVGWVGISIGTLLGLVVREELEVAMAGVSIIVPSLFLSGVVWPLEGMPLVMKNIARYLPFTIPIESLRWIWSRGAEITGFYVWSNCLLLFSYMLLVNILIIFAFKLKK